MKVKFLEDYKPYFRGMQYDIEQVGEELAEKLEAEGKARIIRPVVVMEPVLTETEQPKVVETKQLKKGKK